jgi:hypothetical protein
MSAKSFSAARRPLKTRKPGVVRSNKPPVGQAVRSEPQIPDDPDAQQALAWLERSMPEAEIVYDDDAPKLTPEQLAEFKPARFVIRRRR